MTRKLFALGALALLLTTSACGDDGGGGMCTTTDDCTGGRTCVDGECRVPTDGGRSDGGGSCEPANECGRDGCCAADEECVDGYQCLPICENQRCGDNGSICCGAGEVCLDGVVCAADCGAAETLCGESLEICCPAGDVCVFDACQTPGIECGDDFDCRDASLYCETTLGRCLTTPEGAACELAPEFDQIELVEEWHFEGTTVGGTVYDQVVSTPTVGDVSGDGIPDVIVGFYAGTAWNDPVLVGISGDDGSELFAIGRGTTEYAEGEGVAVANFDPSDDALEFVYRLDGGGIRMMDGDGTTELGLRIGPNTRGTVEVADFNHDGIPDVVVGCMVYDGRDISDPTMDIVTVGNCPSGGWEAPVVADLDGDGEVELTNGLIALNHDGTELWNGGSNGNVAVADLDLDGSPEIAVVGAGVITVLDGATGSMLIGPGGSWVDGTFALPGGGTGGPPTIADFDGDGLPEIATAGRGAYVVYDPDCFETPPRTGGDDCATTDFLRWQAATQDISSSVTGSSVFDFQGDGIAEVVYNDECFLHVYDGRDGAEILMDPIPNSSRTGYEYPIVVDVDGDGNSEIVVGANNDQAVSRDHCDDAYAATFGVPIAELPAAYRSGTHGIYVYGDASDRWVPTRPVWNQYSYHVTNVSRTGVVPATEVDNWSVPELNNYRQNVQGAGVFNAPNLVVELEAVAQCGTGAITLSAVIRNIGSRGVPAGLEVELVRVDTDPEESLTTLTTTGPLLPGGSERLSFDVTDYPEDTDLVYEARVDGADAAAECIEDDNASQSTERCDGLL
ncbi:MAG: hypothetical protein JJ863_27230 [Deltaproteobacteria bacterium]|nr:hypothetical protein [Deltaproteobacteria bacterium]